MKPNTQPRLWALTLVFIWLCFGGTLHPAFGQNKPTASKTDVQDWTELHAWVGLTSKFSLFFQETLRIGENSSRTVDRRSSFGLEYRINKYLTVTPIYRSIAASPVPGQHIHENRFTIDLSTGFPIKKWKLGYRTVADFRFRKPQDYIHFRQRLQLEHPLRLGQFKFQGFVGDEVFYDTRFDAWVRNRFSVGFKKDFTKHFGLEMAYTRQNDGRSRPGDLNILHTILKVRLGKLGR